MAGENVGNSDALESKGEVEELKQGVGLDVNELSETERSRLKEEKAQADRQLGAQVLASVGFQDRHAKITESSLSKEKARGEKLLGKNTQRRNLAYLGRLERLIDKYGNPMEKRLWNSSIEKLVIDPGEIEENYWKSQELILRDNGQGRKLDDFEKEVLAQDIQAQQRESLKTWADYLGDEEAPYPMWFKVFAWDGMSKMGVFDKGKGEFKKRNEHTVAPYPKLNPAALAKVYGAFDDFYKYKNNKDRTEGKSDAEERDKKLDALVRSGSFNKLYSKFLLGQKAILKTPERTEDIRGEWIEYLPGEEQRLAEAAEGTPWCVASPVVGARYLSDKTKSTKQDEWEDEWEDEGDEYEDDEAQWLEYEQVYDKETGNSYYNVHDLRREYMTEDGEWRNYTEEELKRLQELETTEEKGEPGRAKFVLFHLRDPKTGMLADSACASIRLNGNGEVAEVSGLGEGQALDDALVPIVEEKVKTLPGGERFLRAFADKKQLIALDRKMQAEEEMNDEDTDFIWERERKIRRLDSYVTDDPRKKELRKYLIETGKFEDADIEKMLSEMSDEDKRGALPELVKVGLDGRKLIDLGYSVHQQGGADKFVDFLRFANRSGIEDLNAILDMWHGEFTVSEMKELVQKGVNPDIFMKYKDRVGSDEIRDYLRVGVSPELVVEKSLKGKHWYGYRAEREELEKAGRGLEDYVAKNIHNWNNEAMDSIGQLLGSGVSLWQVVNSQSTHEKKLGLLDFIDERAGEIEEISGTEITRKEIWEIGDGLEAETE